MTNDAITNDAITNDAITNDTATNDTGTNDTGTNDTATNDAGTSIAGPRHRPVLSIVLFVSLALNCILAGVVAGNALKLIHLPGQAAVAPPPGGFSGRLKLLTGEERRNFNIAMKPYRESIRDARAGLLAARQHFNEALIANPYDPAAMTAALADLRERTDIVQQRVHEATAQALAVLQPESRALLREPVPVQ